MFPQILVIAYNRPKSLKRLLDSIALAKYADTNVGLIITIDGEGNKEVKSIADLFEWKYGTKEIIVQSQRLGLKKHILTACDNAALKGEFIVLEDDLSVSPFFYQYSISALNYFRGNSNIAGISLYAYSIAESCLLPFSPLEDKFDNYFMRFPSSWGQCFTPEQWKNFRNFDMEEKINALSYPPYILDWKGGSWKKNFIAYMISQNKYFVFPKVSLTTNFAEKGSNFPFKMDIFRVQVQVQEKVYFFREFHEAENIFDEYFEAYPEALKKIFPELNNYDFAVDLYGTKNISTLREENVLTTKTSRKPIVTFDRKLFWNYREYRPGQPGNKIILSAKTDTDNKIRKPDFGAQIYYRNEKNNSNGMIPFLSIILHRIKFFFLNTFHHLRNTFIRIGLFHLV